MAIAIEMPKMSDTMQEGVLVSWLKKEGDRVTSGDVIAQVETDKATMDLEAYDDGVLLKRIAGEGDAVPIGSLIAVLGNEGEDISKILAKYGAGGDGESAAPAEPSAPAAQAETKPEVQPDAPPVEGDRDQGQKQQVSDQPTSTGATAREAMPASAPASGTEAATAGGDGDGRIKASPLARMMAKEQQIDLSQVRGTGPEGRIVKRDIEAVLAGRPAAPAPRAGAPAVEAPAEAPRPAAPPSAAPQPSAGDYEAVPITQMRKTIARRLAESKYTAPHFYLTVDVDMERAIEFRRQLLGLAEEQGKGKISYNDLVTKACAVALRQHPNVNASYLEKEGEIRRHRQVHVAVAVAMEEGLVTPVVRDADRKGIAQIAAETRDLAERARARKLQPADWEGSTFTTSNLGMFGIEEFTAIINPPNACILAVGALRDEAVVRDGQVVPGKRMKLTLSCDHRIVDGASGAQFLQTVKRFLEEPLNLLL